MTVNTLPTSTEIISATQQNADQKVDFASTWDFLIQLLGRKSGQAPQVVASAATLDLDAVTDTRDIVISGVAAITAVTVEAGKVFRCTASGAFTLTNNAAIVTQTGANLVLAAGDSFSLRATAANTVEVFGLSRGVAVATSAILKTGTNNTQFATPAGLLAALGFTAQFQSSQQTITQAGALTIAHGLGREPVLFQAVLVNTTAEFNYTVGDKLILPPWYGSGVSFHGFSLVPDATNLNIRFVNAASVYYIGDKSSGNAAAITLGNWKLVIRAWA